MAYQKIEDLEVYALAENFSNEVWEIIINWYYFAKDTIGKQLCRAVDSISANIAEGYGRFHFKENKNFCYYGRGSLLEAKSFIRKSKDRKLISEGQYLSLISKMELIHLKLNAYIKYIGKSTKTEFSAASPMTNT